MQEIVGAEFSSYSPEDQAFFRFWYAHMKDDLMQPPLANVRHSVARYIWDAAILATTSAVPVGEVKPVHCVPQPAVTEDGYCEWVCPNPDSYLMQCCDCGLIHEVQTRVAKYEPRPSEVFAVVHDADLQAQWRMRRRDDISPQAYTTPPAPIEGWRWVPVEPTPEMVNAGLDAASSADAPEDELMWMYQAMLSAAPQPGDKA